jgi:hypothetical protein
MVAIERAQISVAWEPTKPPSTGPFGDWNRRDPGNRNERYSADEAATRSLIVFLHAPGNREGEIGDWHGLR